MSKNTPHNVRIGTKEHPIRCSKLAFFLKCNMRTYLMMGYEDDEDIGGIAAQNGSLTHEGVAAFHKAAGDLQHRKKAAWDAIAAHAAEFPQAEISEVRLFLTPYMDDPRNANASFVLDKDGQPFVEKKVEFTLEPHELDETQQRIYIQGTLDQLRLVQGVPYVYDLKTGKKTGWEMIHDHVLQLCAYAHGVRTTYGIANTQPGVIIRNHGYRSRNVNSVSPDGVFFHIPLKYEDGLILLESVRFQIAMYRNGWINFNAGPHCTFCEHQGIGKCMEKYNNLEQLGYISR